MTNVNANLPLRIFLHAVRCALEMGLKATECLAPTLEPVTNSGRAQRGNGKPSHETPSHHHLQDVGWGSDAISVVWQQAMGNLVTITHLQWKRTCMQTVARGPSGQYEDDPKANALHSSCCDAQVDWISLDRGD